LQICDEIVYSSVNWNFGQLEQSRYRIKRIGQERPIKYVYFLSTLKFQKAVWASTMRKESMNEFVKRKLEELNNGKRDLES